MKIRMRLDIGMPEMDGNELARLLRACSESAGATFSAITRYGQDADRRRTIEAGFNHHLVKPVDLHELTEILSQIRGK